MTGRYITADPIGLAGGINPFVYASNNSINAIDSLGLADYFVSWTNIGGSKNKGGITHISGTIISLDRNNNKLHNAVYFKGTFAGPSIGAPIGGSFTRNAIFQDDYDNGDVTRISGYSSFTSLTSSLF